MRDNYSVLESTQLFIQNYKMYENPRERAKELYNKLFEDNRIDIIKRQMLGNQLRKIIKIYR